MVEIRELGPPAYVLSSIRAIVAGDCLLLVLERMIRILMTPRADPEKFDVRPVVVVAGCHQMAAGVVHAGFGLAVCLPPEVEDRHFGSR